MSRNLRSTSYLGNDLDGELAKYGARTSGSTERKVQRLRRFVRAEKRDDVKNIHLEWTRKYQQSQAQERQKVRATELLIERAVEIIAEYGAPGPDGWAAAVPQLAELFMQHDPDIIARITNNCLDMTVNAVRKYNVAHGGHSYFLRHSH